MVLMLILCWYGVTDLPTMTLLYDVLQVVREMVETYGAPAASATGGRVRGKVSI